MSCFVLKRKQDASLRSEHAVIDESDNRARKLFSFGAQRNTDPSSNGPASTDVNL
jgi:hypothetical protein